MYSFSTITWTNICSDFYLRLFVAISGAYTLKLISCYTSKREESIIDNSVASFVRRKLFIALKLQEMEYKIFDRLMNDDFLKNRLVIISKDGEFYIVLVKLLCKLQARLIAILTYMYVKYSNILKISNWPFFTNYEKREKHHNALYTCIQW